jgi:hypothetical protein
VNFYTVFSHPAPKDDPTPPAGGTVDPTQLQISMQAGNIVINWATGTLVSSPNVKGPYTAVPNASKPYTVPATGSATFYQVTQ